MNKAQIKKYVSKVCVESRDASQLARKLKSSDRNKVLNTIIKNLRNNAHQIIKKNTLDIKNAQANKISESMIDRLLINAKRIKAMIDGLNKIISIKVFTF